MDVIDVESVVRTHETVKTPGGVVIGSGSFFVTHCGSNPTWISGKMLNCDLYVFFFAYVPRCGNN